MCSFNLLLTPSLSFFLTFSLFSHSVSVWELAVLRGAAASSRLHFTHTKVAVCCSTHRQWLALFSPAWLDGLVPASVSPDKTGSFIGRFLLNAELREIPVLPLTGSLDLFVTRPDSIRSNRYCFMSGCEWCIISHCRLAWAGCIIYDKYWWVLSWGINF